MKVRRAVGIWACFAGMAAIGLAHDASVTQETLKKFFPEAENFVTRQKTLSPEAIQKLEQVLGARVQDVDKRLTVYVAIAKDAQSGKTRSIGGVVMVDAKGAQGSIDLAIGYFVDGKVKKVIITQNKDDKGLESAAFLKQFEGKGPSDNWDQKSFSLAENPASGREVIQAVRRGMLLFRAFMSP